MPKNFEVDLTPQNEEWIKLIPNAPKNMDIVFNKLIEIAINEGLLLEVISQSLTVADLKKFKTTYGKMQTNRAGYLEDLDVAPMQTERKKVTQTVIAEVEEEMIHPEPKKKAAKLQKKPTTHGFDEDTF